ncbi:MAG: (2Fe-2S)-binding protein [Acidobacteria bacterium]|nr:(2Fe-2S)-binding protein [Acidobacteriota bacterium]
MQITFELNNETVCLDVDPLRPLLDVLREELGLTGTKRGCGEGECGACAVLVNDRLVNSCLLPVGAVVHGRVMTIEGFRQTGAYQRLAEAFTEAGAVQCGFCTPGMILAAAALLRRNSQPDETEIRAALAGNLCRCTGLNMIVEAVQLAARRGGAPW